MVNPDVSRLCPRSVYPPFVFGLFTIFRFMLLCFLLPPEFRFYSRC